MWSGVLLLKNKPCFVLRDENIQWVEFRCFCNISYFNISKAEPSMLIIEFSYLPGTWIKLNVVKQWSLRHWTWLSIFDSHHGRRNKFELALGNTDSWQVYMQTFFHSDSKHSKFRFHLDCHSGWTDLEFYSHETCTDSSDSHGRILLLIFWSV